MRKSVVLISGLLAFFLSDACDAGFIPHLLDDGMNCPSGLTSQDVDGNGRIDIVGTSWDNASVVIWYNTLAGWSRVTVDSTFSGATFVTAGDINGDGTIDLAGTAWTAGEIRCWYSDSLGKWTPQSVAVSLPAAHEVVIRDVNSDGFNDLITAVAGTNEISLWINSGGALPSWTKNEISSSMIGARSVCCADYDEDGDIDVAGAAFTGGSVRWWENDGGNVPLWTMHSITESFSGAHMVRTADLDDDGDADLAAVGYYRNSVCIWLNQTDWELFTVDSTYATPLALILADLDADTKLDIAVTSESTNRVLWWRNVGFSGSSWPSETVGTSLSGAWPLTSGDYDQDTYIDLAAGASFTGIVRWYENDNAQGIEGSEIQADPFFVRCFPNPSYGTVPVGFTFPQAGE